MKSIEKSIGEAVIKKILEYIIRFRIIYGIKKQKTQNIKIKLIIYQVF